MELKKAPERLTVPEQILIVDDEEHVRDILSRWLNEEGYGCQTAASAEEGLGLLQDGRFALVVSDIKMPGMSGIDMLRALRKQGSDVAVIMVTGVDDRRTAIRELELGAYGYVIKPFEQNEVLINVVNALERRRLVMASREYERHLEKTVQEQTDEIRISREEIVLRLIAASQYRHGETGTHVKRIGLGSAAMAERVGWTPERTEMLRLAGAMHDVGKIGIPDAVLLKPGKLSPDEWEVMKTHAAIGAQMLEGSGIPLLNLAREVALNHHERWDGEGYPRGLSGRDIPEAARIVAIVDVYDALVHNRVYREAVAEKKARAIVADGRGTQFDPEIHDVFFELLPEIQRIRKEITTVEEDQVVTARRTPP